MSGMIAGVQIDGAQAVLGTLHLKMSGGNDLTESEKLMACSATSSQEARRYGPGPQDFMPVDTPLPESVKGAIFSARI